MNKSASIYTYSVIALGLALFLFVLLQTGCCAQSNDYVLAACLIIVATGSQIGKVLYESRGESSNGTSWYTPLLSFMFAGALVLPPYMLVVLVAIPHFVEWAVERTRKTPFLRAWYIQPFNIATHIICCLVTWEIYLWIMPMLTGMLTNDLAAKLLTSALAGLAYLVVNHYLVGQVMVLACRITWGQSGVLNLKNAACDAGFLLVGVITALAINFSALIGLLLIIPLLFVQRRLAVTLVSA